MEMTAMAEQSFDASNASVIDVPMGDCCNDMAIALKTGKSCKVGQDCKIGSLGLSVHVLTFPQSFSNATLLAALSVPAIEQRPTPIWRPPA